MTDCPERDFVLYLIADAALMALSGTNSEHTAEERQQTREWITAPLDDEPGSLGWYCTLIGLCPTTTQKALLRYLNLSLIHI